MSLSLRRSAWLAVLFALAFGVTRVGAADTQRVPLGQGALRAPRGSWKAIGVPPGSILIDLLDARGMKIQTYGTSFGRLAPRGLDAYGFRPPALPTRHALLAGAAGSQIRKVKIHIKGGTTRTVRTTPSPPDWELSSNRLFALGLTIPARFKNALRVVTKIEGLSASGRVVATLRRVATGAY